MKCGCLVEVDDVDMTPGGIRTSYVIRYCPLHASAEELLKQLKICHGEMLCDGWTHETLEDVETIIARAESKEVK